MNNSLATSSEIPDHELAMELASLAQKLACTEMELSALCQSSIGAYLSLLSNFNQKVNLVGSCAPRLLVHRHALDGLTLAARIRREIKDRETGSKPLRYLDIGTGGGLPGMVVALTCPQLTITLMEATAKKCHFLKTAAQELSITDRLEVVSGRAEELARDSQFRKKYNFVSARAVGPLKLTIELAVPFLTPGGVFLAQKTKSRIQAEMAESKALLSDIGATIEAIEELKGFEELSEALIVPVRKLKETPQLYPRPWKQIASAK